jgi:hypothetical protein
MAVKKTTTRIEGHQRCIICHPLIITSVGRKRARRLAMKDINYQLLYDM